MFILVGLAVVARLVLLAVFVFGLHGREFNDDVVYYRNLIDHPWTLLTGKDFASMGEAGIYAPLMPPELIVPGGLLAQHFGLPVGHRMGMICYDVAALAIALWVAFRLASAPKGGREWLAAAMLTVVPGSLLASTAWGQEDTISAFWAALSLLAWYCCGPVAAAAIAGVCLFTSKFFAVVLMAGIWLGSPGRRRQVAVLSALGVATFLVFLGVRYAVSGALWPAYSYDQVDNAPSPWAAWWLLARPASFRTLRPLILGATITGMLALALSSWRRPRMGVPEGVVAAHAMFFVTFIGIQPEHHQWFLPFVVVVTWTAVRRHDWVLAGAAWCFSGFAYAYKICYGLRGGSSASAAGKQVFRDWFRSHVGLSLLAPQVFFLFATLACGLFLCWRLALRLPRSESRESIG